MLNPKQMARLRLNEVDKMRTVLLEMQTKAENIQAWKGAVDAQRLLLDALADLSEACDMLEVDAESVIRHGAPVTDGGPFE